MKRHASMNRAYRLVWSAAQQAFVPVAEVTRQHGVRRTQTLAAALLALAVAPVAAEPAASSLPQGGQVSAGQARIEVHGSRMDIHQASPQAVLNWQNFNIGSAAEVNFHQPSSTASALNRVLSSDPSLIYGRLNANGQVFLLNPHGVLFGPGARVDVGGLVASTMRLSDADFLSGQYRFERHGDAVITNHGELEGRYIALLAPEVRNEGVIRARLGSVSMAAGDVVSLDISGDQLLSVRVDAASVKALIENRHLVIAEGGQVFLSTTAANQLMTQAIGGHAVAAQGLVEENGVMRLVGTVNNRGSIQAAGVDVKADEVYQQGDIDAGGGRVNIDAQRAYFDAGRTSVADAHGRAGVLTVTTRVGINAVATHGFDASGAQAGQIHLDAGEHGRLMSSARIQADASHGKGGQVELTGETVTLLNAHISAHGSSDGGRIHIGGGWQGSGDLRHARNTQIGSGSTLSVDGEQGRGGEVVLWSDRATVFAGSASARGGVGGGRIEISSHDQLSYLGSVDAGIGGLVLFDPKNITVGDMIPTFSWLGTLTAPGGSCSGNYCLFGGLAADGDRLAVGEWGINKVHLYTGVGGALTYQKVLASGAGAVSMPTISGNFGKSIALSGDLLAVSAIGSDTVYLFNGVGSDFSGLTYQRALTPTSGAANLPGGGLSSGWFGAGLAIDSDRLAVGTPFANGSQGALYMFDGVGSDFSGLTYQWALNDSNRPTGMGSLASDIRYAEGVVMSGDRLIVGGLGYNAYGRVNYFSGLSTATSATELVHRLQQSGSAGGGGQNMFGTSIVMNGDYVLVGASNYYHSGSNYGSVWGFQGADALFAGTSSSLTNFLTLTHNTGAANMPTLQAGGEFGYTMALSGNTLLVGEQRFNSPFTASGRIHQFTVDFPTAGTTADASFSTNPDANSTITPGALTAILNTGANVSLQANNDITIANAVTVNNPSGDGGALSLLAGRHINFNANVSTDNGNLTAIAGHSAANSAYTDAGTPTITIANGVNVNIGTGTATLVANNGQFVNYATTPFSVSGSGRWLIYSSDPANNTLGSLSATFKRYNCSYASGCLTAGTSIPGSGNGLLYSIAPMLSVSPGLSSSIYGDTPTLGGTYDISGFLDSDSLATAGAVTGTALFGGATATSGAGDHDVVYVSGLSSTLGYQFADNVAGNNEHTVNKADLIVFANDLARDYGDANPTATVSYSGFKNGETSAVLTGLATASIAASATHTATAGSTHAITASGAAANNYDISYVPGTLTINKAYLTVGADNLVREYGDANPIATVSYSGFKNGETSAVLTGLATASIAASATHTATAGSTHAITASGAAADNYDFNYINGNLSISKASLTVAVDDVIREYGDANPAATFSYSGFKNGETNAVLVSGAITTIAATASATATAGSKHIISASGASAVNYDFNYVDGHLTIDKATLLVTAQNATRSYGDANPIVPVSYSGFKNGESAAALSSGANTTIAASATASAAAGSTHLITASGASSDNYRFNYATGTLTINKALLTVSAADLYREYGDANPLASVNYSGFKNGETSAVLATQANASIASSATPTANAGSTHLIALSAASAANYDFQYLPGSLTVTPAILTVSVPDLRRVYGAANPAVSLTYSGFKNGETEAVFANVPLAVIASSANNAAAAGGTHLIGASGGSATNYTFNYVDGTLSIDRRPLRVTAESATKFAGGADPIFAYATETASNARGLVNGDSLVGNLSRASGESPGTYAIGQGSVNDANNPNYQIVYVGADLVIQRNDHPQELPYYVVPKMPDLTYGSLGLTYVSVPGTAGSNGPAFTSGTVTVADDVMPSLSGTTPAVLGKGSLFVYDLPKHVFRQSVGKDQTVIDVRMADGSSLPPWLKFDPTSGRFTGILPAGAPKMLSVVVVVRDSSGNEVATRLNIALSDQAAQK